MAKINIKICLQTIDLTRVDFIQYGALRKLSGFLIEAIPIPDWAGLTGLT